MHTRIIARVSGALAIIFGLSLCGPLGVAIWYQEAELTNFLIPMLGTLALGGLLWLVGGRSRIRLSNRDGYIIVSAFWVLLSLLGTWPLILSVHLGLVDALFESTSAVTTTGATVITGLDDLPKSILFYRQQLQWLGGMGLIVLGVAVLPMLGIGGMQLYRAEAPGPMKEEKLTPRLADTARALWTIYLGLTISCAIAYWLAGMTPFDAIAHSFSTVSTGGFSTHDASLGFYASPAIEAVAIFFMVLAAINFGVHYFAWHNRNLRQYLTDIESRSFLLFVLLMVLLVGLTLRLEGNYEQLPSSLRDATFEVVSVVTSTGFGTVDFAHWPDFLPVLLIFISFVGGCGGSTAGGIKVMRVLLLVKQGQHEIRRLIHPNAILPVRIGQRVVEPRLMQSVWGFFAFYVATFGGLMLVMIHAGLDQVSAYSAVATSMNNLGPGLGEVAYNFQSVSPMGKLVAVIAMLLGRLEIFTILVLLSPGFWRK
ncbi:MULTISPECIES: TrkH family potassium uptake protein [sulfur-oxidizing symbionts]|nr:MULTISPECIES: TrkH family potassium uptake protein [sulfur-oxidizing symbionts]EGV51888.1 Trk system potassium uptake protein trkH [endosymbiont of Riftia pachyptila (vent Ph05)]USF88874.1 TrkH family potassium uptake protein [Candidatus Endoriftia persephone]